VILQCLGFPYPHDAFAQGGSALHTLEQRTDPYQTTKVVESYGKLPLYFIRNDGQMDEKVKYYERGSGHTTYLTEDGISIVLSWKKTSTKRETKRSFRPLKNPAHPQEIVSRMIRLSFLHGNPKPELIAQDQLEGKVNHLIGHDPKKWKTDIPTFGSVIYKNIYPGIDAKFYGNQRQLEYDLIVHPGADPKTVKLVYEGIDALKVAEDGGLEAIVQNENGKKEVAFLQRKPIVYQETASGRKEVKGKFAIIKNNPSKKHFVVAFDVAPYDKNLPLIIDPILIYSTYLGGSGGDLGSSIAVDGSGNAYVTGYTYSTDFPTQNPFQRTLRGRQDVFVTKLNPSGNALVYSTYLGGSGDDTANSIAVDGSGNAYVTGYTYSTDFPTQNPFQRTLRGRQDVFVTKLNPSGNALVYSTYLGGSGDDLGFGIAVDGSGNAYVTGSTSSTDFPTQNPFQGTFQGTQDAFVIKLSESTIMTGTIKDSKSSLTVANANVTLFDSSGNSVANTTSDASGNFSLSGNIPSGNYTLKKDR